MCIYLYFKFHVYVEFYFEISMYIWFSVFTWGNTGDLTHASDARLRYLRALQEADSGNFMPLIDFARC